jgi:serine/threonine protein kinase
MNNPQILNDRYQLNAKLGSGGMAHVYRAMDLMLQRNVAVKVLKEDYSADLAFRERFRQEARSAANLSHPNIVTVHDFGLDQGHLFIVMEYIPGTDLKSLIKERGRLSVTESLELMIQACQGVGYAHRAGLVHCDIKPHNFLVTPDMLVKVTDFGIARALSTISKDEKNDVVWGSPHYFAPEQASGLPPMPASDVYSLGVIFYELLTGKLVFDGQDSAELSRMHRTEAPVPPTVHNPDIPEQLEAIILKVLSKEPSARYRTADQLGRLLQGFYETQLRGASSTLLSGPAALGVTGVGPVPVTSSPVVQAPIETPAVSTPQTYSQNVAEAVAEPVREKEPAEPVDWLTWVLGIVAFIFLIGLVPFWFYIYSMIGR